MKRARCVVVDACWIAGLLVKMLGNVLRVAGALHAANEVLRLLVNKKPVKDMSEYASRGASNRLYHGPLVAQTDVIIALLMQA